MRVRVLDGQLERSPQPLAEAEAERIKHLLLSYEAL